MCIKELKYQPIYKGVHKTLCINFRAFAAFCPKIMYISLLDRKDIFEGVAIRYLILISLKCFGLVYLKDS